MDDCNETSLTDVAESNQFWEVETYGTVESIGDPEGGLPPARRPTDAGGYQQVDDDGLTGLMGAFAARKPDASPPPPTPGEPSWRPGSTGTPLR